MYRPTTKLVAHNRDCICRENDASPAHDHPLLDEVQDEVQENKKVKMIKTNKLKEDKGTRGDGGVPRAFVRTASLT